MRSWEIQADKEETKDGTGKAYLEPLQIQVAFNQMLLRARELAAMLNSGMAVFLAAYTPEEWVYVTLGVLPSGEGMQAVF
jgi:hypothetical protein